MISFPPLCDSPLPVSHRDCNEEASCANASLHKSTLFYSRDTGGFTRGDVDKSCPPRWSQATDCVTRSCCVHFLPPYCVSHRFAHFLVCLSFISFSQPRHSSLFSLWAGGGGGSGGGRGGGRDWTQWGNCREWVFRDYYWCGSVACVCVCVRVCVRNVYTWQAKRTHTCTKPKCAANSSVSGKMPSGITLRLAHGIQKGIYK